MLTKAPKGTKDVLPKDIYKWNYVEDTFREICKRYGYGEIRTPVFEHTELFKRGVGETTDIVQKEMYTFEDHGGRSISLRPEGTASVVRAFLENNQYAETQPTKYAYNISCYRYENTQTGRYREFHQFGVECFGAPSMIADAEIISLAKDFLKGVGIKDLELRLNSVGCPQCRAKYREALREYFRPHFDELCDTCKVRFETNPMRIIDCKSPKDKEIAKGAPSILDYLCEDCNNSFEELKQYLDASGIEYVVDPTIVRGLDYYTKTAFEFVTDQIGAQGTVCGGGRYDNLINEVGGQDIPGVGFGLGIERLLLLMESQGVEIPEPKGMDALVVTLGDAAKIKGIAIAGELRAHGLKVDMDSLERNMKGQLKFANKRGYSYAIVIGDNELEKRICQVKDMFNSTSEDIAFDKLAEYLIDKKK